MVMLMTNATADYDGSGSPSAATGSVLVTLSGTKGTVRKTQPVLVMYSRSDTADFAPTFQKSGFGRFKVNLAAADDYYFTVTGVESTASIDLSVVAA